MAGKMGFSAKGGNKLSFRGSAWLTSVERDEHWEL